jgi:hypothetical protein
LLENLRKAFRDPVPYVPPDDKPEEEEETQDGKEDWLENMEKTARPRRKRPQPKPVIKQEILGYLKASEGEAINFWDLAKLLGYSTPNGIFTMLGELEDDGYIRRKGKKGSYHYRVLRSRMRKEEAPVQSEAPQEQFYTAYEVHAKNLLKFLREHQGEPLTYAGIFAATGIPMGSVSHVVNLLHTKGLIESYDRSTFGTRYRVLDPATPEAPRGPNPDETKAMELENGKRFSSVLDDLAQEFMRETWSTNLLQFQKWVELKSKRR